MFLNRLDFAIQGRCFLSSEDSPGLLMSEKWLILYSPTGVIQLKAHPSIAFQAAVMDSSFSCKIGDNARYP